MLNQITHDQITEHLQCMADVIFPRERARMPGRDFWVWVIRQAGIDVSPPDDEDLKYGALFKVWHYLIDRETEKCIKWQDSIEKQMMELR